MPQLQCDVEILPHPTPTPDVHHRSCARPWAMHPNTTSPTLHHGVKYALLCMIIE
jgi:hypothetical protein